MSDRKLPVRVHRGGLSGRYFAITNYKVIDAERDLIEARTKHDVTEDVRAHIWRAVALALSSVAQIDSDAAGAIPQFVWDQLYREELLRTDTDAAGEPYTTTTNDGLAELLSMLEEVSG